MIRMKGFCDLMMTEEVPHSVTPTMLADLPGGYLDAAEKAGRVCGDNPWEHGRIGILVYVRTG